MTKRMKLTSKGKVPFTDAENAIADTADAEWEATADERTPEAIAQKAAEQDADQRLVKSVILALKQQFPAIDLAQFRADFISAYKQL